MMSTKMLYLSRVVTKWAIYDPEHILAVERDLRRLLLSGPWNLLHMGGTYLLTGLPE